jgi:hypothetical protein
MKIRLLIFIIVFAGLFSWITLRHKGVMLATSANSWTDYGWPNNWLQIHRYTNSNGEGGHIETQIRNISVISWRSFGVSVFCIGGFSLIIIICTERFLFPIRQKD